MTQEISPLWNLYQRLQAAGAAKEEVYNAVVNQPSVDFQDCTPVDFAKEYLCSYEVDDFDDSIKYLYSAAINTADNSVADPNVGNAITGSTGMTGSTIISGQTASSGYFIITTGGLNGGCTTSPVVPPKEPEPTPVLRTDWYLAGDQVEPVTAAIAKLNAGADPVSLTLGHSYGVRLVEDNPKSPLHPQLVTIEDDAGKTHSISGVWFEPIRSPK